MPRIELLPEVHELGEAEGALHLQIDTEDDDTVTCDAQVLSALQVRMAMMWPRRQQRQLHPHPTVASSRRATASATLAAIRSGTMASTTPAALQAPAARTAMMDSTTASTMAILAATAVRSLYCTSYASSCQFFALLQPSHHLCFASEIEDDGQ